MTRRTITTAELLEGLERGDRRALARSITLIESTLDSDAEQAADLLEQLRPRIGGSIRVGLSGVPGVGKSTFIEALGTELVAAGTSVAVLAVDPTSSLSGGSVLGDKTRMAELSRSPSAFIRPQAGGDASGGVAHRTREAMLLCEAAGFDVVIVETIGVGQSETAVASMVDEFLLLALSGAGDELQGIKRGILELADTVLVTKADGPGKDRAESTAAELHGALRILRGHSAPLVATCSSRTGDGIQAAWKHIAERHAARRASGELESRRDGQELAWFERTVDELVLRSFHRMQGDRLQAAREAVRGGSPASATARRVVDAFLRGSNPPAPDRT